MSYNPELFSPTLSSVLDPLREELEAMRAQTETRRVTIDAEGWMRCSRFPGRRKSVPQIVQDYASRLPDRDRQQFWRHVSQRTRNQPGAFYWREILRLVLAAPASIRTMLMKWLRQARTNIARRQRIAHANFPYLRERYAMGQSHATSYETYV